MSTAPRLPVAITGCGWELPRFAAQPSLDATLNGPPLPEPLFTPEVALGKKGLRYKEKATLLALCAAKAALRQAGLLDEQMTPLHDQAFGVVVASNTGNLDTVCRVADVIRQEHVNATSAMDLPNASSNVVASTLAIRFGLKAMNLMVCSGASASLDAVILAANAIRNGRAERMLVVSTETDGLALRSLVAGRRLDALVGDSPVLEGAAAIVLESTASVAARGAHVRSSLVDHLIGQAGPQGQTALYRLLDEHPTKRKYVPSRACIEPRASRHEQFIDLGGLMEEAYGSAALLQLIHATEHVDASGAVVVGGGTWLDLRAGALVLDTTAQP